MILCENIKSKYKECFSRYDLEHKEKLENKRIGKERILWSTEEIQKVFDEVKKGTSKEEIFKMFPNRTELATLKFISTARKKLGINGKIHKTHKKVMKFDAEGNYIETFDSAFDASCSSGASISNIIGCCTGYNKSVGGFVWKYAE